MSDDVIISVEHLSKRYRLGQIERRPEEIVRQRRVCLGVNRNRSKLFVRRLLLLKS